MGAVACNRLRQKKISMKKKHAKKKSLPPFVPMYVRTMESSAWLAMSLGARALFLALKKRYYREGAKAVYLSTRVAAKELGASTSGTFRWYHELEHYGFIVRIKPARSGERGLAAHYKLADEPYLGKPPSAEFSFWSGVPFEYRRPGMTRSANGVFAQRVTSVRPASHPSKKRPQNGDLAKKRGVRPARHI